MNLFHSNKLLNIPSFSLSDSDYTHPSFSFINGKPFLQFKSIDLPDSPLIQSDVIFAEFKFPYSFVSTHKLISNTGFFSIRDVVDFIRSSFATHFKSSPSPAFVWERSLIKSSSSGTTDYHVSYPFSGMFASFVSYNESTKMIFANIECFPFVDDQVSLPF